MGSNVRKRPADPFWRDNSPSKVSKVTSSGSSVALSTHALGETSRSKASLNGHQRPRQQELERRQCTDDVSSISKANLDMAPVQLAAVRTVKERRESPTCALSQPAELDHIHKEPRTSKSRSSNCSPSKKSRRHQPSQNSVYGSSQTEVANGFVVSSPPQPTVYAPQAQHQPHSESKLGHDFHWVPYPLGLLPYDSWHKLHNPEKIQPPLPFRCPVCKCERKATPHIRKIFLVAERLSWEAGVMPVSERESNEELNWAVNYELGILEPFMEDPELMPGGRNSQKNIFHPYKNEYEMKQALKLLFTSENITEVTWSLWLGMQLELEKVFGIEKVSSEKTPSLDSRTSPRKPLCSTAGNRPRQESPMIEEIDLTVSPDSASQRKKSDNAFAIPTPPSSCSRTTDSLETPTTQKTCSQRPAKATPRRTLAVEPAEPMSYFGKDRRIGSYKTLQDFYSLLDQIERTSYVGALFLEAYAERLRDDVCRECWANRYIDLSDPAIL